MSEFTVREQIPLQPDPDPGSPPIGTVSPGERLTGLVPLGNWVRVEVNRSDGRTQEGWIPAADIEEIVGQTVQLYEEPLSDSFVVLTGTVDWLREPLENWRKASVTVDAVQHTGWINLSEIGEDIAPADDEGDANILELGINEVYRKHLLKAQEITGIDAAALAALIDAEAGKIKHGPQKGMWNPNASNSRSSAAGLTQFLDGTWLEMARKAGSFLNQVAKAKHLITELNAVASGRGIKKALLNLRFDPELAILSAAEYGFDNLKALARRGLIPHDVSDDEKARYMYLAHHEGPHGAVEFLKQINSHSRRKLKTQVGASRADSLIAAAGGNVARAYRNWLNSYMDKKIQPGKFRRAGSIGTQLSVGPSGDFLSTFTGSAIPMYTLGGRKDLVNELQVILAELGYLDPPADGLWGSVSNWALEEFCNDNSLSLSGGFSPKIARTLLNPTNPLPDIKPGNNWFDKVVAYMNDKGYWICRHPGCTNIVYLEGVNPDGTLNDDRPNAFNDLRVVFTVDASGVPQITSWDGTTEPGKYFTENPIDNVPGAARIAFGQYKSWTVGIHRRGRRGAHEALVQERFVSVYRDLNKDYQRKNDKLYTGIFGINQHWGYDKPKHNLGSSSAGCLVGRTMTGHREFMRLIKQDARYQARQSYKFMTAILPGDTVLGQSLP